MSNTVAADSPERDGHAVRVGNVVTVRALATLAAFAPSGGVAAVAAGTTVGGLARKLGLSPGLVGTVLVNGRPAEDDTPLAAGDAVSFVPPITGG